MIKSHLLSELATRFGGVVINGDAFVESISTDTRTISAGSIFIALVGDNFDGHHFIDTAILQGASALVVQQAYEQSALPQWVVEDTTHALGFIAQLAREDYVGKLVGITGSSGKTTVKEMLHSIFQVASSQDSAFATQGNLNNHIGVPFSLLALNAGHRYAVIEMGASAMGEINYLTHLAKPDVALVNNVMAAHIEGFGSLENIATAKGEIYNSLRDDGIAVINYDDVFCQQWIDKNQHRKTIGFSLDAHSEAEVKADNISQTEHACPSFTLMINDHIAKVCLQVLGQHNIANALAASACAYAAGISLDDIVTGLEAVSSVKGRLHTLTGVNNSTLIDDSYNANPGSVRAAIDVLANIPQTTVLVLGNMGELGEHGQTAHFDLGVYARDKGIDHLLVIGDLAQYAADGFSTDNAYCFTNNEQLVEKARALASDQTVFLIKGSRSSRMDRVVDALKKQRGEQHATVVS